MATKRKLFEEVGAGERAVVSPQGGLIDGRGKLDLNKENTTTGCHGIRVRAPALKVGIFNMTIRGAKAVS